MTLASAEKEMVGVLTFFQKETRGFRTGKAHPALVETVTVEVYGTTMRLSDIASISVSDIRQLLLSPYDAGTVSAISKGILAANLNLQPIVEGATVRINVPEPTEEYRREVIKQLKRKSEEAKVAIRNIRRTFNDRLKKDDNLTEDAVKSLEKKIQELTDKFCKQIEELAKQKEAELATV
ncbi:ribosome recycling factor [Chlamydia trachomatis]|uniref:ribosome recycling factor n=1 Tax=Chlamydia trachomatis TaxID=813 RepID=UPI0002A82D93|nr:ribosome recycling factor [Chlamydia trachomatis]AGT71132.1 ribosome recycling factor [Chlamydia trachomatis]ATW10448.1 ribosome recycling factor [Chlamydia trachomatis]ATW11354.1 ribosome recycling factor [Chlamydia trachomatis]ATW12248.1 ribosome recycling factor [Chlamydia trachomatis]ATW13144.1 ribosome recycling factor [Chlamydia trachomatis]